MDNQDTRIGPAPPAQGLYRGVNEDEEEADQIVQHIRRMPDDRQGRMADRQAHAPAAVVPIGRQPHVPAAAPNPRILDNQEDRTVTELLAQDRVVHPNADHQPPDPAAVPVPRILDNQQDRVVQPVRDIVGREHPAPAAVVPFDHLPPVAAVANLNCRPRIEFTEMEAWFWRTLSREGHEMVVTSGRRTIQPRLHFDVNGLHVAELFSFGLCVQLVDTWIYKYKGCKWIPEINTRSELPRGEIVAHPDGEKTGGEWMAAPLRFDNVRITLNETKAAQDRNVICLEPKRKYKICVIVWKRGPDSPTVFRLTKPIPGTEFITTPEKFKNNVNYWLKRILGVNREEIRRQHVATRGLYPPIPPEKSRKKGPGQAKVFSSKRTRFN